MPLSLPALRDGIESVCANPADSVAGCAKQWADAVKGYAAGVVPPSTAVAAAAAALESSLVGAFGSPAAAPGMEAAFAAFGAAVGLGMLPAYAAVPPTAPVGFASLFAGPKPGSHAEAAGNVADLIDSWMKTGSATLVAPPNTPLTWT